MSTQNGFTLIEMMVVVAIVALLAVIALPLYQGYVARAQVSEAIVAAGQLKTALSDYRVSNGGWPSTNRFADTVGGRYYASLSHDDSGQIEVTMRNSPPVNQRARGFVLRLSPVLGGGDAGIVSWTCSTSGNPLLLPSGCQ